MLVAAGSAHAFLASAVTCGAPFQFWVSPTGAAPVRVVYRWQRRTSGCKAIPHATAARVVARTRVRAVVTATFADGTTLRSVLRIV